MKKLFYKTHFLRDYVVPAVSRRGHSVEINTRRKTGGLEINRVTSGFFIFVDYGGDFSSRCVIEHNFHSAVVRHIEINLCRGIERIGIVLRQVVFRGDSDFNRTAEFRVRVIAVVVRLFQSVLVFPRTGFSVFVRIVLHGISITAAVDEANRLPFGAVNFFSLDTEALVVYFLRRRPVKNHVSFAYPVRKRRQRNWERAFDDVNRRRKRHAAYFKSVRKIVRAREKTDLISDVLYGQRRGFRIVEDYEIQSYECPVFRFDVVAVDVVVVVHVRRGDENSHRFRIPFIDVVGSRVHGIAVRVGKTREPARAAGKSQNGGIENDVAVKPRECLRGRESCSFDLILNSILTAVLIRILNEGQFLLYRC